MDPSPGDGAGNHLAKRHYYTCGDATLSWADAWYTAPFFTSHQASYDSVASSGPVNPPSSVINTVPACSAALSAASVLSVSSLAAITSSKAEASGTTTPSPSGLATVITSTAAVTTTQNGQAVSTSLATIITTTLALASSTSTTISTSSPQATVTGVSGASNTDPWSQTVCAGGWDYQSWGVVGSLLVGVLGGLLVWLFWSVLRGRMPGFYSSRTWFVPPDLRPSVSLTFIIFFLPFLHLPSLSSGIPLSEGQLSLHLLYAALKLAGIGSLVALAAGLPLYLVNTPCLSETSPTNPLGGRLGTLTDLSLLRLLNALDPSPDLPVTTTTNQLLQITKRDLTSTIRPAVSDARVRLVILLVTMAVFLIGGGLWTVTRVYAGLEKYRKRFDEVVCAGQEMVWISGEDAVGWKGLGEEGVKESLKKFGLSGERVGERILEVERSEKDGNTEREKEKVVDVVGVFAISRTYPQLTVKVEERKSVLEQLEVAETKYINSFRLIPTSSNSGKVEHRLPSSGVGEIPERVEPPVDYVAPRSFYKIPGVSKLEQDPDDVPTLPSTAPPRMEVTAPSRSGTADSSYPQAIAQRIEGSRFIEVNRDSMSHGGKRFQIGQRVKLGEDGVLIAESSPESSPGTDEPSEESGGMASAGLSDERTSNDQTPSPLDLITPVAGPSRVPQRSLGFTSPLRPDVVSLAPAPSDPTTPSRSLSWPRQMTISPKRHARTGSYIVVPLENPDRPPSTAPIHSKTTAKLLPSTLAETYHSIGQLRLHLKTLNYEITEMQQLTFEKMAVGNDIIGWVLVGKGLEFLPFAQRLGRSREDILWNSLGVIGKDEKGEKVLRGRRRREVRGSIMGFWVGVVIVGVLLGLLVIPVTGLTVGSAPGFAHYLPFMKSLEGSNSFGSGFTLGVVPAITLSISVALAIFATNRLSKRIKTPSYSEQRTLAYKGTFWLLFFVTVIWFLVVASLEYSVQGFASGLQEARTVGDGSIFSTWAIFVILLNIAVIVPALTLLQSIRLLGYIRRRRKVITPRQRFLANYPPSYNPSYALAGSIIAVFYATSLILFFPLLAIPIILLLFLSLVANSYLIRYVCVDSKGAPTGGHLVLWTIRRFGWTLAVQPFIFGLVLLSRLEWGLGGASLGIAVIVIILVELLTIGRFRATTTSSLPDHQRQALLKLQKHLSTHQSNTSLSTPRPSTTSLLGATPRKKRRSNSSILEMIHTLLPGVSRLPPQGALLLEMEGIDCFLFPEKAAWSRVEKVDKPPRHPPLSYLSGSSSSRRRDTGTSAGGRVGIALGVGASGREREIGSGGRDEVDPSKGLIYPPELLAFQPIIWLADDEAGIARAEVADLEVHHRLGGMVDPTDEILRRRG